LTPAPCSHISKVIEYLYWAYKLTVIKLISIQNPYPFAACWFKYISLGKIIRKPPLKFCFFGDKLQKELVFPGSFLSTEEEFLAGANTYIDSSGSIFSDSVGVKEVDEKNREIKVKEKLKEVKMLERGCTVYGVISNVREQIAMVELKFATKDGYEHRINNSFGILPVFNVSDRYIESLENEFKIGDIIKANVANVTTFNVELETKSSTDFGVVRKRESFLSADFRNELKVKENMEKERGEIAGDSREGPRRRDGSSGADRDRGRGRIGSREALREEEKERKVAKAIEERYRKGQSEEEAEQEEIEFQAKLERIKKYG